MTDFLVLSSTRFEFEGLVPGAHVAVVCDPQEVVQAGLDGRRAGLELRDTLVVLGPTTRVRFALLFRKSLDEATLVEQVLKTGTGALNIDACRVAGDMSELLSATGNPRSGAGHAKGFGMEGTFGGSAANPPNKKGRWPSNLLLIHGEGCQQEGLRRVYARGGQAASKGQRVHGKSYAQDKWTRTKMQVSTVCHAGLDGKEDVAVWACEPGCPVTELDQQTGDRRSAGNYPTTYSNSEGYNKLGQSQGPLYADSGGASRFYPQLRENELVEWLRRLIDPTGV